MPPASSHHQGGTARPPPCGHRASGRRTGGRAAQPHTGLLKTARRGGLPEGGLRSGSDGRELGRYILVLVCGEQALRCPAAMTLHAQDEPRPQRAPPPRLSG